MSKDRIRQMIVCQLILIMFFVTTLTKIEAVEPEFGITTIVQIPGQYLMEAHTQLSKQGHFVAGISQTVEETENRLQFTLADLHVWDVRSFSVEQDPASLNPSSSYSISHNLYGQPIIGLAIAPDEQYVAMRINTTVQILTLPDLTLYKTMRFSEDDYQYPIRAFAWSPNSQMLMMIQEANERFTVWDIFTDETYFYETGDVRPSEQHYGIAGDVEALNNGWLVSGFDDQNQAFMFCDWHLQECDSYRFEHSSYVLVRHSADGEVILTSELNIRAAIWEYQSERVYELSEIVDGCIEDISPSGVYIYLACSRPYSQEAQIVDTETYTIVHSFNYSENYPSKRGTNPVWLPDEDYFVVVTPIPYSLQLYQLGNEQLIDEFRFPSPNEYQVTGIRFAPENVMPSISENGDVILTNMGGIAFLTQNEH